MRCFTKFLVFPIFSLFMINIILGQNSSFKEFNLSGSNFGVYLDPPLKNSGRLNLVINFGNLPIDSIRSVYLFSGRVVFEENSSFQFNFHVRVENIHDDNFILFLDVINDCDRIDGGYFFEGKIKFQRCEIHACHIRDIFVNYLLGIEHPCDKFCSLIVCNGVLPSFELNFFSDPIFELFSLGDVICVDSYYFYDSSIDESWCPDYFFRPNYDWESKKSFLRQDNFLIYPNPAKDYVVLELPYVDSSSRIFNLFGEGLEPVDVYQNFVIFCL